MELSPTLPEETSAAETDSETGKKRRRFDKLLAHWSRAGRSSFRFAEAPPDVATEEARSAEIKTGRRPNFLERFRALFSDKVARVEFVTPKTPETKAGPATNEVAVEPPETATPENVRPPTEPETLVPPIDDKSAPPRRPAPPAAPPPLIPPLEAAAAPEPPDHDRTVAERLVAPFRSASTVTPEVPTNERIIERPRGAVAVAALLGLEYLGRKRADRKLRKNMTKQLARQQTDTQKTFNRVDHQAHTTNQELHEIKQQQQAFEKQLAATERPPEPRLAELKLPTVKLPQPAEIKPNAAESTDKLPFAEELVKQVEQLKQPSAVLARVESAAEQDLPVEAIYERRHEVKQQPAVEGGGGVGGASSQEPILLAQALAQRFPANRELSGRTATATGQPQRPPELYKQAVKNGIWGGVAVVVLMGIIFLVAR